MANKKLVSFGTFVRLLDEDECVQFQKEMKNDIHTFLSMGYNQQMTDNDMVNYLIQVTNGRYGICDEVVPPSKLLVSALQKYISDVKVVGSNAIPNWVARISEDYDADHVIGYSLHSYRNRYEHPIRTTSLKQFIASLDDVTYNLLVSDLSIAIDKFVAMGSYLVMDDNDPWLNYLIQVTNGGYGWCDIKIKHRPLLAKALFKYKQEALYIYTEIFRFMIDDTLESGDSLTAVTKRLQGYRPV